MSLLNLACRAITEPWANVTTNNYKANTDTLFMCHPKPCVGHQQSQHKEDRLWTGTPIYRLFPRHFANCYAHPIELDFCWKALLQPHIRLCEQNETRCPRLFESEHLQQRLWNYLQPSLTRMTVVAAVVATIGSRVGLLCFPDSTTAGHMRPQMPSVLKVRGMAPTAFVDLMVAI